MKNLFKKITTMTMTLGMTTALLMPTNAYAEKSDATVTEEAWANAVTVYGGALQNNQQLLTQTQQLLHGKNSDKTAFVDANDVLKYLNLNSDTNVLYSSIRIQKLAQGKGLSVTIDQTEGKITKVTELMYKNALISAGVTDANVEIASPVDVTGESALTGIYVAFEQQGVAIDPVVAQAAQDELSTVATINEENKAVQGYDESAFNKAIAEIKAELANKDTANLSVDEATNIVQNTINNNGLGDIINQGQINNLVNVYLNLNNNTNIFNGDNAQRVKEATANLVTSITQSPEYDKAKDKLKDLGQNISDTIHSESFWDKVKSFFNSIIDFFKNLFT